MEKISVDTTHSGALNTPYDWDSEKLNPQELAFLKLAIGNYSEVECYVTRKSGGRLYLSPVNRDELIKKGIGVYVAVNWQGEREVEVVSVGTEDSPCIVREPSLGVQGELHWWALTRTQEYLLSFEFSNQTGKVVVLLGSAGRKIFEIPFGAKRLYERIMAKKEWKKVMVDLSLLTGVSEQGVVMEEGVVPWAALTNGGRKGFPLEITWGDRVPEISEEIARALNRSRIRMANWFLYQVIYELPTPEQPLELLRRGDGDMWDSDDKEWFGSRVWECRWDGEDISIGKRNPDFVPYVLAQDGTIVFNCPDKVLNTIKAVSRMPEAWRSVLDREVKRVNALILKWRRAIGVDQD
jgi:hypothetical protein